MAVETRTRLVDDLDKTSTATETFPYTFDGVDLELDLTAEHAAAFRDAMAPWVAISRRRAGKSGPKAAAPASSTSTATRRRTAADSRALRVWARANGWPDTGTRGRVPADAAAAYDAHVASTA